MSLGTCPGDTPTVRTFGPVRGGDLHRTVEGLDRLGEMCLDMSTICTGEAVGVEAVSGADEERDMRERITRLRIWFVRYWPDYTRSRFINDVVRDMRELRKGTDLKLHGDERA
jgi:hypothetical protein